MGVIGFANAPISYQLSAVSFQFAEVEPQTSGGKPQTAVLPCVELEGFG
jgi:hypothetical protein